MNKLMEKHSKKSKKLLKSTLSEDLNTSLERFRNDKEFEIKKITEITITIIMRSFNLFAEYPRFRTMKKVIISPVKARIKSKYNKKNSVVSKKFGICIFINDNH